MMKQPIKGKGKLKLKKVKAYKKKTPFSVNNKKNQQYGTSKLEFDFAHDFLDRFNLCYVYQFEAKDIGRFYDFAVTSYDECKYVYETKDGIKSIKLGVQSFIPSFLIEIDGGYYHSDPRVVDEDKLNPMQKHNKFVDKLKDQWAGMHCIPLLRIWEYDIRNNPNKVIEELSKYIDLGIKKRKILENKKRPH